MKKVLLYAVFFITAFTINTQGQTLTYETLPDVATLGESIDFDLMYTSTVEVKMEVSLNIFDIDSEGNLTQDWSTWQASTIVSNLPATTTATAQTITLSVPGSIVPSSELPAGKTYVWALSLKDMSDGWITGEQVATTLVASVAVTNTINFTGTTPTVINAGSTVAVNFSYTLAETGIVKIALSKYDANEGYIEDIVNYIINPAEATTATSVDGVAELLIPDTTTPSASLENGEMYKWEIAVYDPNWGYLSGNKNDVTVSGLAGIEDKSSTSVVVYPNPVANMLSVNIGVPVEIIKIYDITGKKLMQATENTIDVSSLTAGVYFMKVNDSKTVKFIKK